MSFFRSLVLPAALLGLAACAPDTLIRADDASAHPAAASSRGVAPSTPGAVATSTGSPQFLQPAAGAATIANPVVSFWAKRGVDRTAEMYYRRAHGGRDSVVFFSLRVRAKSLWRRPDGTAFASGDSVLITLTLVDAQKGIVDCQPSGLRFDPGTPARLKVSFAETDDDVNHDGRVNALDAALTRTFAVWRREAPTDPWIRQASIVSVGTHEVESEIGGFTGYAIAW
jgi:hypothetical protein